MDDKVDELDDETLDFLHKMFDLARAGDAPALADYLANGLPANLTNDKGDTLLILAAYHDHSEAVRALLAANASVDPVNDRGQTALAAAVFRRNSDSVEALLEAGAQPGAGNPSALATAQFFELPEMKPCSRSIRKP